mmetsp:Transcript_89271/g.161087  ORF Transcript_89271/g.161087 Transcript_89271/m.161087 type:complete len:200 (+) Transcript_89271:194-793(+)
MNCSSWAQLVTESCGYESWSGRPSTASADCSPTGPPAPLAASAQAKKAASGDDLPPRQIWKQHLSVSSAHRQTVLCADLGLQARPEKCSDVALSLSFRERSVQAARNPPSILILERSSAKGRHPLAKACSALAHDRQSQANPLPVPGSGPSRAPKGNRPGHRLGMSKGWILGPPQVVCEHWWRLTLDGQAPVQKCSLAL